MSGFWSKESIVARPGFNRWRVPPAAIGMHVCIGSVYAWSIYNPALTRVLGVAAPSADDWTLGEVVWVFMVAMLSLGLATAVAGKWIEEAGPRTAGLLAAVLWGSGYLVGGLGIETHQLWLLYLGYGVLGGCGLGLAYVSPVGMLIRWFPDRRGMATGMAIMGFGGGAILAAPLKEFLMRVFREAPDYLGPAAEVELLTEAGRRFAEVGGRMAEVVVVGAGEAAGMIVPGPPGVYVVGTGSVGAAPTFLALGLLFLAIMLISAWNYRLPPPDWRPEGWTQPDAETASRKMMTRGHVHVDRVFRTPQFYQLWVVLCLNVTAGLAIIGIAKTMVVEIFGTALPSIVNASFAAAYVLMIGVFNLIGRLLWASVSDYIGRRNTYWIFCVGGIALYLSVVLATQQVGTGSALLWLGVFCVTTMAAFTFFGGGFAAIPAYIADLFGTHHVSGIHGRLLTAWSVAGVLGPLATTSLRKQALEDAIRDTAAKVDPGRFLETFGSDIGQLELLISERTVTLAKLLEIAPPGIADPSPGLYDGTMYLMAFLLLLATIANAMIRPVHPKHHIPKHRMKE